MTVKKVSYNNTHLVETVRSRVYLYDLLAGVFGCLPEKSLLNEIRNGNKKHVNLESIPAEVRKRSFASIFNWIIDEYDLEDKILFGSDIKWTYHVGSNREKEIKFAQNLGYSKQRKEKWLYYNAKRFLGLK